MKAERTPFAAHPLAGLLADMRLESARRAAQRGVLVALHALILSALTRLLGRLDALLTLWQSGQLPTPTPVRTRIVIPAAAKDPRSPHVTTRSLHRARPLASPPPGAAQPQPQRPQPPSHPTAPAATPPPIPLPHPRFHKPPWPSRAKHPEPPALSCILNVSISKLKTSLHPQPNPASVPSMRNPATSPVSRFWYRWYIPVV